MNYSKLSKDQKVNMLEQRLVALEAEHYSQEITAGQAKAIDNESGIQAARELQKKVETEIKYVNGELAKLQPGRKA